MFFVPLPVDVNASSLAHHLPGDGLKILNQHNLTNPKKTGISESKTI
jgi:hypothetical protein